MNCSQARKTLYPMPGKCAVTIDNARAMQHLRECLPCRTYFEAQSEWSRLLKEKLGTEPAPEPLRQRIAKQVEQRPAVRFYRRRFLKKTKWIAVAVAVLLPVVWVVWNAPSVSLFQHISKDHARYLNGPAEVESSEPAVVERWFRGKSAYAVRVPAFENAELLGGTLCFVREKQAALVFYRKKQRRVSLFEFSEEGVSLRGLNRSVIEGAPIWRGSFQGYNVAAFPQRGMIFVLVSDLRESELLELASEARVQSRGF